MTDRSKGWRQRTRAVRAGLARSPHGETSEALYLNSGFVYDSAAQAEARFLGEDPGFIYSRYGNPTVAVFEQRLAALEGAEVCFATASGMAAVFAALMCSVRAGQRVVASRALFGSCHHILTQILPRYGVESELVDGADLTQWRQALSRPAAAVFFETPANPTLELIDIAEVCALAHAAGARAIVDNVFATPVLQQSMPLGADIVVYSGTKHIDGQGRCLGGAVLCSQAFFTDELQPFVRHTGPALSPFNAWVLLKGLETLDLRVREMCRNAAEVADAIAGHRAIVRLLYPFRDDFPQAGLARRQMAAGGSVLSFELAGGKAAAFRLLDALRLVDISNNLGDAKSLVTHPATTTHRAMGPEGRAAIGVTDGLVRLSVGLEDPADVIEDLAQALDKAALPAAAA